MADRTPWQKLKTKSNSVMGAEAVIRAGRRRCSACLMQTPSAGAKKSAAAVASGAAARRLNGLAGVAKVKNSISALRRPPRFNRTKFDRMRRWVVPGSAPFWQSTAEKCPALLLHMLTADKQLVTGEGSLQQVAMRALRRLTISTSGKHRYRSPDCRKTAS